MNPKTPQTYKEAGVDIEAGNRFVQRIKPHAAKASRPEVVAGIGGFAGLCGLPAGYHEPLLVSSTDGVGTKLKWAFATGKHDTVGIDLVAMCVNDVAVTGAEPLFFLDYFATAKLDIEVADSVIAGIAKGCREAGCALLGGETAELPGFYAPGEYDLAGFAVGVVEKSQVKEGRNIVAGDVLVGLASSGLHANGHALAHKVILEVLQLNHADKSPILDGLTISDVVLEPTRIYVNSLRSLSQHGIAWKAAAHITGGGLIENPPRMLPKNTHLAVRFHLNTWPTPPIFQLIAQGGIDATEMRRTFNLGLGMVVVVHANEATRTLAVLKHRGETAFLVGEVIPQTTPAQVEFVP